MSEVIKFINNLNGQSENIKFFNNLERQSEYIKFANHLRVQLEQLLSTNFPNTSKKQLINSFIYNLYENTPLKKHTKLRRVLSLLFHVDKEKSLDEKKYPFLASALEQNNYQSSLDNVDNNLFFYKVFLYTSKLATEETSNLLFYLKSIFYINFKLSNPFGITEQINIEILEELPFHDLNNYLKENEIDLKEIISYSHIFFIFLMYDISLLLLSIATPVLFVLLVGSAIGSPIYSTINNRFNSKEYVGDNNLDSKTKKLATAFKECLLATFCLYLISPIMIIAHLPLIPSKAFYLTYNLIKENIPDIHLPQNPIKNLIPSIKDFFKHLIKKENHCVLLLTAPPEYALAKKTETNPQHFSPLYQPATEDTDKMPTQAPGAGPASFK